MSHDYERQLLSGILRYPKSTTHLASELEPGAFDLEPHRHIATAIVQCCEQQKPLHVPVVWQELVRLGLGEVVGGVEYLRQMSETVVVREGLEFYASHVRSEGAQRRFLSELGRLYAEGVELQGEGLEARQEWQGRAASELGQAMAGAHGGEFRLLSDVLDDAITHIEDNIGREPGVRTGLARLDRLSRMHPGDLIVIAARPAMGKTSLLLQVLDGDGVKAHGGPVALFSLEMPGDQLGLRLIAERAGVSLAELRATVPTEELVLRLRLAAQEFRDRRIYIDDRPGLTIEQMRAGAHRLELKHGQIAAIGIDYLQICGHSPATRGKSTADALGHITKGAKAMAKERHCPVLMGSQLTRDSVRGNRRPGLHDLRDSGSIEADIDSAWFIHGDPDEHGPCVERWILVSKARNGQTGDVKCNFMGETTTFVEVDFVG